MSRYLFPGDSLWVEDGVWRAVILGESDRSAFLETLALMRDLDFDVLVPWPAQRGRPVLSLERMEELVALSQSALSQHLARLRRDKLVRTRRAAQNIFYSLNGQEAQTVMATLHTLFCKPAARPDEDSAARGAGAPAA